MSLGIVLTILNLCKGWWLEFAANFEVPMS